MFEFLTTNPAAALLKADHDRVKELFDRFEEARTRPAKLKIVRAALVELKVHAAIEEELFYPAVRKPVGKEIMNEADEEHHVAKLLIAELQLCRRGGTKKSFSKVCGRRLRVMQFRGLPLEQAIRETRNEEFRNRLLGRLLPFQDGLRQPRCALNV